MCCHVAGAIKKVDPLAINVMSGKSYEQEFDLEQERMKVSLRSCRGPYSNLEQLSARQVTAALAGSRENQG
jgi:hypothetical protein